MNVDVAVAKTQSKGAIGAVCRDELGRFQGASIVVFEGITDAETLEALACREALDLSEDLGLERVHLLPTA